jgi:hypothetical protein
MLPRGVVGSPLCGVGNEKMQKTCDDTIKINKDHVTTNNDKHQA